MRRSSPSRSLAALAVLAFLGSATPACGPRADEVSGASPAPEASGIAVNTPALFDEQPQQGAPTPPSPNDSAQAPPAAPPGEEPTPPPGIIPTLVGSAPTEAPGSWTYVNGEILLGALKDVDSNPKTALTQEQLNRVSAFLESIAEQTKVCSDAERKFLDTVQATLSPRQLWAFSAEAGEMHQVKPDLDVLVEELGRLASDAPEPAPSPSASPVVYEAVRGSNEMVVGLQFLSHHPKVALTPEQARDLLPAVKVYALTLKDQAAQYPRLAEILTPAQRTALARNINRVKPWQAAEPNHYISFNDFRVYLAQRSSK